jgi:hypothetical protein
MMGRKSKLRSQRRNQQGNQALSLVQPSYIIPPDLFVEKTALQQRRIALSAYPYPLNCFGDEWRMGGWVEAAIEFMAIEERERLGWQVNDWQQALKLLLNGILTMAGKDDPTADGLADIKLAGHKLGDIGGCNEMMYTCQVWVPKELQRLVDATWNGIHGWLS